MDLARNAEDETDADDEDGNQGRARRTCAEDPPREEDGERQDEAAGDLLRVLECSISISRLNLNFDANIPAGSDARKTRRQHILYHTRAFSISCGPCRFTPWEGAKNSRRQYVLKASPSTLQAMRGASPLHVVTSTRGNFMYPVRVAVRESANLAETLQDQQEKRARETNRRGRRVGAE